MNPKIYVACLAAYNNGKLHGKWIDANQDAELILDEISDMLKISPEPDAEEFAIHDYEGFGSYNLREYEPISKVSELGQLMADDDGELILELMAHMGFDTVQESSDYFDDNYAGEWDSLEDWCEDLLEGTGQLDSIPEQFKRYFDVESYARDIELSGDVFTIKLDNMIHVFWSR